MKIETSHFKRLIGIRKTEGMILTKKNRSALIGTASYEFILDVTCMLHKVDVIMGNDKSETIKIISLDNSSEQKNVVL